MSRKKKMKKIYLAISYSSMKESSYVQANEATAIIMNKGINVFSPISHCHIIAKEHQLPTSWDYWMQIDFQFIDWAEEVWVLIPKEGVQYLHDSPGVNAEIKYAKNKNLPINFIKIVDGEVQFIDYIWS